jgi:hypothetical protein
VCRKSGLEARRRCGRLGFEEDPVGPPVWARRGVCLGTCPKSYISVESESLVEEYLVRRRFGDVRAMELSARQAEAFAILENELSAEIRHGQQNTRAIA